MDKQFQYYGAIGVFVIIFVGWLWINTSVFHKQHDTAQISLSEIEGKLATLEMVKKKYPDIEEQLELWQTYVDSLRDRFPTKDTYMSQMQVIRETAEKHQIEILSFSPNIKDSFPALHTLVQSSSEHIERYPVQIRLFGTYLDIGAFTEELHTLDFIVNIGNIKLETEFSKPGGLVCNLVLFTYMMKNGDVPS